MGQEYVGTLTSVQEILQSKVAPRNVPSLADRQFLSRAFCFWQRNQEGFIDETEQCRF